LWRCDVVDVGRRRLSKRVAIDANVFYPFEYPKHRVLDGRAWNEIYVLRRFLEYNERFRIVLMNTFLEHFHEDFFANECRSAARIAAEASGFARTSYFASRS
jgi:hypothetical protein